MRLHGGHVFHITREAIWACLFDTARLAQVLPGCERFEQTGPTTYAIELRIGLPMLKGLYRGTIEMSDAAFPERFTLGAQAKGPAGSVRGTGHFALAALAPHGPASGMAGAPVSEGAWSRLTYDGDVQFTGMLKLLGAQAVSPAARVVIDRFFQRLEAEVVGQQAPRPGASSPAAPPPAAESGSADQ